MILYALYLCLYWYIPNAQDTCHVMSPPQILFSRDDCMAYFSHGGFHDSVSDTLRKHFLCGETGGIPGHSLVLRCEFNFVQTIHRACRISRRRKANRKRNRTRRMKTIAAAFLALLFVRRDGYCGGQYHTTLTTMIEESGNET
jgi:hypothetical protein